LGDRGALVGLVDAHDLLTLALAGYLPLTANAINEVLADESPVPEGP
jgi:hypothetical protein